MAAEANILEVHTVEEIREMAMAEAKSLAAKIGKDIAKDLEFNEFGTSRNDDAWFEEGDHLGGSVSYDVDSDVYEDGDGYWLPITYLRENVRGEMELKEMVYVLDDEEYYEEYHFTDDELSEIDKIMSKAFEDSLYLLEG